MLVNIAVKKLIIFAKNGNLFNVTPSPLNSQGNAVTERCIQTIKFISTQSLHDNRNPYFAICRNSPSS